MECMGIDQPCVRLDLADSILMLDWELQGEMLDLCSLLSCRVISVRFIPACMFCVEGEGGGAERKQRENGKGKRTRNNKIISE